MGRLPEEHEEEGAWLVCPPTLRTLQPLWGQFGQRWKKKRREPGSGQQPCLAGVSSCTLSVGPDARETL